MRRGRACSVCGSPHVTIDDPPACECCYGWQAELASSDEVLPLAERQRRLQARVAHFAPLVGLPYNAGGQPWPVDAELVDDEGLAPDGLPADPEFDIDNVTVAALTAAAIGSGRLDAQAGLGTQRKRLVALSAELVGVTVEHADELVADQAVAEELLAKLTPAAQ